MSLLLLPRMLLLLLYSCIQRAKRQILPGIAAAGMLEQTATQMQMFLFCCVLEGCAADAFSNVAARSRAHFRGHCLVRLLLPLGNQGSCGD